MLNLKKNETFSCVLKFKPNKNQNKIKIKDIATEIFRAIHVLTAECFINVHAAYTIQSVDKKNFHGKVSMQCACCKKCNERHKGAEKTV